MAVYKVPQDVEAEDKLVGFLTAKQLLFLFIAGAMIWIALQLWQISWPFGLLLAPPIALFLVLGLWPTRHQPIELYLAAMVRFYFKNHTRVWQQTGVVDRVIVNTPKTIRHKRSDGRSEAEVEGNLKKLAQLMDSKGWNQKNQDKDPYAGAEDNEGIFADTSATAAKFGQALEQREVEQQDYLTSLADHVRQGRRSDVTQGLNRQSASVSQTVPTSQPVQPLAPSQAQSLSKNNDWSVDTIAREANQPISPPSSLSSFEGS